jgi:hypothetical protein
MASPVASGTNDFSEELRSFISAGAVLQAIWAKFLESYLRTCGQVVLPRDTVPLQIY